ncbi:MAG: DUF3991 and toprim domain-containing protein [Oscillospiraceae bacterium]|nr:DUF3991 and toprim domain-containing protein [Oscillospiraceae bacterium]
MRKSVVPWKYTNEQWKMITNANCVDTALALGFQIDEKGSDKKAFHLKESGGLFVWKDGSGFFQFSTYEKGIAIDLVTKISGLKYGEALDWINNNVLHGRFEEQRQTFYKPSNSNPSVEPEKAEFKLPDKTRPSNTYAYLIQRRGLEKEIVSSLFNNGSIFQEAARRNCCFVGFDKNGEARYCSVRGTGDTQFRGDIKGSDKRYGFSINGNSNILKVFESPIEAMSHASLAKISGLDWRADTRLSLGGCFLPALEQHLADHPDCYSEIWVCTNNDEAGRKAGESINEKFGGQYKIKNKFPYNKDFNDDLIEARSLMNEHNCEFKDVLKFWKKGEPIKSNAQPPPEPCLELG